MGGNTADVYGFGLMLSIGDISEDAPGMRRRQALEPVSYTHLPPPERPAEETVWCGERKGRARIREMPAGRVPATE